jgi:hypothetical protein
MTPEANCWLHRNLIAMFGHPLGDQEIYSTLLDTFAQDFLPTALPGFMAFEDPDGSIALFDGIRALAYDEGRVAATCTLINDAWPRIYGSLSNEPPDLYQTKRRWLLNLMTIFQSREIIRNPRFNVHTCDPIGIQREMIISTLERDEETAEVFFRLTMEAAEDADFQGKEIAMTFFCYLVHASPAVIQHHLPDMFIALSHILLEIRSIEDPDYHIASIELLLEGWMSFIHQLPDFCECVDITWIEDALVCDLYTQLLPPPELHRSPALEEWPEEVLFEERITIWQTFIASKACPAPIDTQGV